MKRSLPQLLLVVLCAALCGLIAGEGHAFTKVQRITKEELKAHLNDPSVVVIDVRTDWSWGENDKKIKGALREDPLAEVKTWASKYPKEKRIVLYCS
jgi:rhodanese-related sulfurtransferase